MRGGPSLRLWEKASLPEGFKVRNTFIHIESTRADDRAVQSMPDGMFKQCIREEIAQRCAIPQSPVTESSTPCASAQVCPTPPQSESEPCPEIACADSESVLHPGVEVVIEGLSKAPHFNGLAGTVQCRDEATGRYTILLSSPAGPGGHRWAKVKAENLRLAILPPPPCFAPSFSMEETLQLCGDVKGSRAALLKLTELV